VNFLKELWRGDVPLYRTFWVFFFVVFVALRGAMFFLASLASISFECMLIAYGIWGVLTLWTLFSCVAVWRSVGKYTGGAHWGILAQCVVGWYVVQVVLELVQMV